MKLRVPIFYLLLWLTGNCSSQGPNALLLEKNLTLYHSLAQSTDDTYKEETFKHILDSVSPLLSENQFTHPNDINQIRTIMFKTSILMTAILNQMELYEPSQTLYMNAYLLSYSQDKDKAFHELKKLLPKIKNYEIYESISLPEYKLQTSSKVDSDGLKTIIHNITITEISNNIILQGICGDIFYKMKDKKHLHADIHTIIFQIYKEGKLIARGNWNKKEDKIILQRLPLQY